MSDNVAHVTPGIMREIRDGIAKINLRLDDIVREMRENQNDISLQRGQLSGVRHDIDVYAERWRDHEVRLKALEKPESNGSGD
jgi:low affinity Fe/Cu permease